MARKFAGHSPLNSRFANIDSLSKRIFRKIKLVADTKNLHQAQRSLRDRSFHYLGRYVREVTFELPWRASRIEFEGFKSLLRGRIRYPDVPPGDDKARELFEQYIVLAEETQQITQDGSILATWTEVLKHCPNVGITEIESILMEPFAVGNTQGNRFNQPEPTEESAAPNQEHRSKDTIVPLVFAAIASAGIRPISLSVKGPLHPSNLEVSRISNWEHLDLSRVEKLALEYEEIDKEGYYNSTGLTTADLVTKILAKRLNRLESLELGGRCDVPAADATPLPKLKHLNLIRSVTLDYRQVRRWVFGMERLESICLQDISLGNTEGSYWRYVFEAIVDHPNAIALDLNQIRSNDWTEFSAYTCVPLGRKPEDLSKELDGSEADENGDDGDEDEDEGSVDGDQMLDELDGDFENFVNGRIAWTSSKALNWFFYP